MSKRKIETIDLTDDADKKTCVELYPQPSVMTKDKINRDKWVDRTECKVDPAVLNACQGMLDRYQDQFGIVLFGRRYGCTGDSSGEGVCPP